MDEPTVTLRQFANASVHESAPLLNHALLALLAILLSSVAVLRLRLPSAARAPRRR